MHNLDPALEIHDAIAQKLFSASLIADVLPRLWERDPSEARARLHELQALTQGAMDEMQNLLNELRYSRNPLAKPVEDRMETIDDSVGSDPAENSRFTGG